MRSRAMVTTVRLSGILEVGLELFVIQVDHGDAVLTQLQKKFNSLDANYLRCHARRDLSHFIEFRGHGHFGLMAELRR